jgi:hypothetical protein
MKNEKPLDFWHFREKSYQNKCLTVSQSIGSTQGIKAGGCQHSRSQEFIHPVMRQCTPGVDVDALLILLQLQLQLPWWAG